MEQRFPQSLLLSSLIHLLVLGLCFLLLPLSTPKPAEKMVTIDLVTWDGPLGDGGQGEKAAPKKKIVQVPQQVGKSETRSPVHHPRPKAKLNQPKTSSVAHEENTRDLEAALSERFERERSREAERASALGAAEGPDVPQSPGETGKYPGSNPGGISGTGTGMSGQLATRGVVRRVLPDYPSWAERKWLEGDVRLRLWVNPQGEVIKVQAIGIPGTRGFEASARAALKQWRFSPIQGDEIQTGEITIYYRLGQ